MHTNPGLFDLYLNDLQIAAGLCRGFEDEAFAVVYGLTRIRQVPFAARAAWFEANYQSTKQTPDWVLALPTEGGGPHSPEFRWKSFVERVSLKAMSAYQGGIDDKRLQTPNLREPWSLWSFEFNNISPLVLGKEGGSAATGQTYVTPATVLKAPGAFVDATKQRGYDFLKSISPGGTKYLQNASDALEQSGFADLIKGAAGVLFWAGVKKMAPALASGLVEISTYATALQAAVKSWPAIVAAMIAAGAWDLETLQANQSAVNAYERDKKRRDFEASLSTPSVSKPDEH